MPAVYAHRRFGEKVLAACQNDVARTAIESYPDLYNIGLTPRPRPSSRRGPPM